MSHAHYSDEDDEVVIDMTAVLRSEETGGIEGLKPTRSDWDLFDVAGAIDAEVPEEAPADLVPRQDGPHLLYRGKVHSIAGEPESGKGWFAIQACAWVLTHTDEHVLYIDFEDSPLSIIRRMIDVGAPPADIRERFHVIAPESALPEDGEGDPKRAHFNLALKIALRATPKSRHALVILDGVTQAIANQSSDSNDNDAVAKFFRELPRIITKSLADQGQAPAVLMVDHVVKSKENRSRYAIGAGTKLAAIDGVQFMAEVKIPFSRTQPGLVRLTVAKDRPGHVRAVASGIQHAQAVCDMRLTPGDDNDGSLKVTLHKPDLEQDKDGSVRPTAVMKKVMAYLRRATSPRRAEDITAGVHVRKQTVLDAIHILLDERTIAKIEVGRSVQYYLPDDAGNQSDRYDAVEVED